MQPLLQFLIREIEPKLGGAYRIDCVERGHAMVALVPTLIPFARIDAEQNVRADAADDRGRFFGELRLRRIFQHPVVVPKPHDVLFQSAQHPFRDFFLCSTDPG